MTRKDYVALAGAFTVARYHAGTPRSDSAFGTSRAAFQAWELAVLAVADVLAADNPRFDRERFIKACQGEKS